MNGHELKRRMWVHQLIGRIYLDDRFPGPTIYGDLRMFAISAIWVSGVERPPRGQDWARLREVTGLDNYQMGRLIGEDAPRYEPREWRAGAAPCEGEMIRRAGICGQLTAWSVTVTDPATGEWRHVPYCRRHKPQGEEARRLESARRRAGSLPTPMPNTGGLLPCYLEADWPELYTRARRGWKPPEVGIRADDWPVTKKVAEKAPPKLHVLAGDDEPGDAPGGEVLDGPPPQLRLVKPESP